MIALRQALRRFKHSPLLVTTTIGTLAVGIGVNVLSFMFLQQMVLRPLDVPRADRLVAVWEVLSSRGFEKSHVSPLSFLDWRARQHNFEDLAATAQLPVHLRVNGHLELGRAAVLTPGFVELVGMRASVGRLFTPPDFTDAVERSVVVLSHRLWQHRFGGETSALGGVIHLNEHPYTVVGVLDPATRLPREADLWLPVRFDYLSPADRARFGMRASLEERSLMVIGRMRDGISIDEARSDMQRVAAELSREYPDEHRRAGATVTLLRDELVSPLASTIRLLQAALGLVWLVVCINIANMLHVRTAARQVEFSILLALGGQRSHLLKQLGLEAGMMVGLGSVLGCVLALVGHNLLLASPYGPLLDAAALVFDARVAGFAVLLAVSSGVLVSLIPLIHYARFQVRLPDVQTRAHLGSRRELWFQKVVVGAQLALSLPMLFLTLQLIENADALKEAELGFEPEGVVVVQLTGSSDRFGSSVARAQALDDALARLRSLPFVDAAGAVSDLPLSGSNMSGGFRILGVDSDGPAESNFRAVTPEYFETMGIEVKSGRSFLPADNQTGAGVAIVNQSLARRYWPGGDAIGRMILIGTPQEVAAFGQEVTRRIVGIVSDVDHNRLGETRQPELYVPFSQNPMDYATVVARLSSDTPEALGDLKAVISSTIEPHFLISKIAAMDDIVSNSLGHPEILLYAVSLLGGIATLLIAMSVYAVSSHFFSYNRRAIAIRMALGASYRDLASLVARHALGAWMTGVLAGIGLAYAALRLLDTHVYLVDGPTAWLIALGVALLGATALAAVAAPIRRALSRDPMAELNRG